MLIDPQKLGTLFLGQLRVDSDPYTGFARNTTTLRFEASLLFHVRDPRGARVIAAAA